MGAAPASSTPWSAHYPRLRRTSRRAGAKQSKPLEQVHCKRDANRRPIRYGSEPEPMKTLYTAEVRLVGGRVGHAQSSTGNLSLDLSSPPEMGGPGGDGTNPEQLFAAG